MFAMIDLLTRAVILSTLIYRPLRGLIILLGSDPGAYAPGFMLPRAPRAAETASITDSSSFGRKKTRAMYTARKIATAKLVSGQTWQQPA
jgi:hypothetical protein